MSMNKNILYYGAAYYPELWDASERNSDIERMKEVGINIARMGEFAWSSMEPDIDKIDLSFFKDTIRLLHENGINSIFCTPTPTPPVWVTHDHPERMHVDDQNVRMSHGARQHICTNNAFFRQRSMIITEAIARELSDLPGMIGWQIDNEFKGHVSECHCDTCRELWHQWLELKYGDIAVLNKAWGTDLWSQRYQDFSQIPAPLPTPFAHNPSLTTAYRRFHREKVCEFQNEQIEVIRKYSDAPITHNSNLRHYIDHNIQCKELDFAVFDDYHDCDNPWGMLMNYDLWRNIKPGRPFWVMETSPSHNGCIFGYRRAHRRRYIVAEAVAAYASGAQGFCYWLWRQQKSGVEMPHGSIITAWGTPSVGFDDVKVTGEEVQKITPCITQSVPCQAEIAIVYSDIARAFFLTEPVEGLNYLELMSEWYQMVHKSGFHRDVLLEDNSLDDYKIVMTPFMPNITDKFLDKAETFVRNGGTWIVGPLSGTRTFEHTAHTDAGLGKRLEDLAGIKTAFMFSPTMSEEHGSAFGVEAPLSLWSSFFDLAGAKELGSVTSGRCPGKVFAAEHTVGKGKIVMLGSMPAGKEGLKMLQKMITHYSVGINKISASDGTEIIPRKDADGRFCFVVNMDGKGGSVDLPGEGTDLLTGEKFDAGKLAVEAYEYRVIRLS